MEPFTRVTDHVLSLAEDDVDTDIIYPARFLTITERTGLGRFAFHDRRGTPGFPLGVEDERTSAILVTGANFGCGSSREQAPWALAGLGIRAVLAPSFGEIFAGNCARNGILAVTLPPAAMTALHAGDGPVTVDLVTCTVHMPDGTTHRFDIAAPTREALLNGWDETARIRALSGAAIARFEDRQRLAQLWLWSA